MPRANDGHQHHFIISSFRAGGRGQGFPGSQKHHTAHPNGPEFGPELHQEYLLKIRTTISKLWKQPRCPISLICRHYIKGKHNKEIGL
jgi:hypothetical protein